MKDWRLATEKGKVVVEAVVRRQILQDLVDWFHDASNEGQQRVALGHVVEITKADARDLGNMAQEKANRDLARNKRISILLYKESRKSSLIKGKILSSKRERSSIDSIVEMAQ